MNQIITAHQESVAAMRERIAEILRGLPVGADLRVGEGLDRIELSVRRVSCARDSVSTIQGLGYVAGGKLYATDVGPSDQTTDTWFLIEPGKVQFGLGWAASYWLRHCLQGLPKAIAEYADDLGKETAANHAVLGVKPSRSRAVFVEDAGISQSGPWEMTGPPIRLRENEEE